MNILTIDPGLSGGYAFDTSAGMVIKAFEGFDAPLRMLRTFADTPIIAVIEEVHASPIQSQSSAFKFGQNYGEWVGMLRAFGIPTFGVRPQVWQHEYHLESKGAARKRDLLKIARGLTDKALTLATCDAFLMSGWARANLNVPLTSASAKKLV